MKKELLTNADISDSPRDKARMQSEEVTIDMPEVKDIPGQENIRVPKIKEMADTTISSSDEEGEGILDDLNKEEATEELDNESNVSPEEAKLLQSSEYGSAEEAEYLDSLALDSTDDEGELLNEKGFGTDKSGSDLDVPGAELDDDDEEIGEEDEENNQFSRSDEELG